MTKDRLFALLDEQSLPDRIIGMLDAPQWRFWRREAHIKRNEVYPLLREYIELRMKKSDAQRRENTYSVFAKLLLETFEPAHCQFLIDRLTVETNKYVLHTMLSCIARLPLSEEIDISPVAQCSKNSEWMVRHSAIMALGKSNTDASRQAVRYWVRQEDEKQHKFELIYGNAALGFIGEPSDIALLERHIHSRIPDVKDSAIYAINHIRQRFGMEDRALE